MHWVDRGPEPERLRSIKEQNTERWVQHYRHHVGARPTDNRWREFGDQLRKTFHNLCAYCETECRGEVDHFRPKSRFPEFVYYWSNWVLSCHDCNLAKQSKWPSTGYVNPCAKFMFSRPERYFSFDTLTGEILPNRTLNLGSRRKAQNTIDHLRLNDIPHPNNRLWWIKLVSAFALDEAGFLKNDIDLELAQLVSIESPLSSFTKAWLSEQQRR